MLIERNNARLVFACFTAVVAVTGCQRPTPQDTADLMKSDPSAVCASDETRNGLRGTLLDNLDLPSDPASAQYAAQLRSGTSVALDAAVMEKYDKDLSRVTCSGKLIVAWPASIANRLRALNSAVNWASDSTMITYSIQPAAHASSQPAADAGFVYTIYNPGGANLVGSAQTMVEQLVQSDAAAAAAAEAAKAAAAQSAAAAGDTAGEILSASASSPTSPSSTTPASTHYSCSLVSNDQSHGLPAAAAMSVTVDEARECINNRTAYFRTANGGLARMMLVDSERRVSLLSFSPDRATLMRQDFSLNALEYGAARGRGQDLLTIRCPATIETSDVADVQTRLGQADQAIAPAVSGLSPARRMTWRCVADTQ